MQSHQPHRAELESWTVDRVLSWATDDFRRRHLDSPRLDAELLLGHALGMDRVRLILERQRPLLPTELAGFRELIKRRRAGEPIAYIRGTREFYGLPFRVDRRALIPRPDTETLVDVALARTRHRDLFGRAIDLGTGSGCVTIALSLERPTWQVTGVDVDADALQLARSNALALGAVPTARFLLGDLFEPVTNHEPFDLVVSNPPYIPTGEYEQLDRGIHDFEPRLALHGGADGLDVMRRIVAATPARLAPGGVLAVEMACDQGDAVQALLEQAGLLHIERTRDYAGLERVVSGVQAG